MRREEEALGERGGREWRIKVRKRYEVRRVRGNGREWRLGEMRKSR